MSRNISVDAAVALQSTVCRPVLLVRLTYSNETVYLHSAVGNIIHDGNTYLGMGAFGSIGTLTEASDVSAQGMTLILSGVPTEYLTDALQFAGGNGLGQLLLAFMLADGSLVMDPIVMFSGIMDAPQIDLSTQAINITVSLESRMSDLQRSHGLLWTAACQTAKYPLDQSFNFVAGVEDVFINWRAK